MRDLSSTNRRSPSWLDVDALNREVLLDGSLLLGHGLAVDLAVHLALRPDTETRRTPLEEAWTLADFSRYRREVDPERRADVVVRSDHPDRPALVVR